MNLKQWEPIIQAIVDELRSERKKASKTRIIVKWRVKLEKEPPNLQVHQIDEIVREVRRRLETTDEN